MLCLQESAGVLSDLKVTKIHVQVVMENGILKVTLSNPGGIVTGIQYNNIDNLLEVLNDESNRGYLHKLCSILQIKELHLVFLVIIYFQLHVGIGTLFGAHQQVQEPVVHLMCMSFF